MHVSLTFFFNTEIANSIFCTPGLPDKPGILHFRLKTLEF